MINILVVSHGKLAAELIKSAEMIAGEAENLYSVMLQPTDTPEMFEQKLNEVMDKVGDQETLIMIDIFSGTPYNVSARQVLKPNVECVTGVNLPMLVEAILSREDATIAELAENISQVGVNSVKNLKPMLRRK